MALERKVTDVEGTSRFYSDVGYGELFHIHTGVTYSTRDIYNRFAEEGCCGEYNFLRRLSPDVDQVRNLMHQRQTTMVVGDLGAGKSTVIFGVRRVLREEKREYVHIDGHFTRMQSDIIDAINMARLRKMPAIYDSFDYLFRKRSKVTAMARKAVLGQIRNLVDDGGGMLVSSHTEPWLRAYLSTDSLEEYYAVCDELGMTPHRVMGYLGDEPDRRNLALDMTRNHEFIDGYMRYSEESKLPTSRTYRVLKQLTIANPALLDQQQFNDEVTAIDTKTRQKMRAPDDYDLCPLPDVS